MKPFGACHSKNTWVTSEHPEVTSFGFGFSPSSPPSTPPPFPRLPLSSPSLPKPKLIGGILRLRRRFGNTPKCYGISLRCTERDNAQPKSEKDSNQSQFVRSRVLRSQCLRRLLGLAELFEALHYNVSVNSDSARHILQRRGPSGLKHSEIRCLAIQVDNERTSERDAERERSTRERENERTREIEKERRREREKERTRERETEIT